MPALPPEPSPRLPSVPRIFFDGSAWAFPFAMGASRFADAYVRQNYEIAKLCGPKGGGFIVDTHTLHRGAVEGSLPRTVIVGEYHSIGKCAAMDALKLGLPCPSGDQFLV